MACVLTQNFEEVFTPSRKRKRTSPDVPLSVCNGLSNEGFSSTPRKDASFPKSVVGWLPQAGPKFADTNPFASVNCMEVKSIAEIASERTQGENPYEVIRKPPKKKKKADIEDACFENPALNLDVPEKRFNPFEVKRELLPSSSSHDNCFVNSALNIKSPENVALNPFEIVRNATELPLNAASNEGIENLALEAPTTVTIGLPFTPTVGCRIDFNGVSLDSLTPSKLLAEKLVFSPTGVKAAAAGLRKSFRRSLSVISEETVDIGKELDCYQLELENSINEAKMKKKVPNSNNDINENLCEDIAKTTTDEVDSNTSISINITNVNISLSSQTSKAEVSHHSISSPSVSIPPTIDEEEGDDFDDDDDEIDFKAPAPFVRCFRKADNPIESSSANTLSTSSDKSTKENDNKHRLSTMIRKSIRRIIHSHSENDRPAPENSGQCKQDVPLAPTASSNNFMASIRRSLRRKPNKKLQSSDRQSDDSHSHEISILDLAAERKVFKFNANQEDVVGCEIDDSDRRQSFLRRSLRKSTRGIRNHVLKKVFHKNVDEYKMEN